MLENNKCYLLDCGDEIYLWFGRATQVDERKSACHAAEDLITSQNRPKATCISRVIQGYESHSFKSHFDSWPAGSAIPGADEGRGKVAALLKQKGAGVKCATKGAPVNEEVPPLLVAGGKIEVWRVDGSAKISVPKEDIGKFYSGDCYIILYSYHSGDKKDDYYLCWWIGKDSIESFVELHIMWNMTMEEQKIAAQLANTMSNSLKGRPALGRIFQGKEPPQFVALFEPMIVLKGGLSSGSKLAVKALGVEPYAIDGVALIQISGISTHNRKFQVEEIYNFTQDDLLTEDTLILDTHAEVFVWVGHTVDPKEKQEAFEMGEKYIALAASLEGLPQQVPLYKITEGNEPCFFTTYFSWDSAKAIILTNNSTKATEGCLQHLKLVKLG
ncbi:hypothetical protein V2J09_006840 [Rumex salicifolius]